MGHKGDRGDKTSALRKKNRELEKINMELKQQLISLHQLLKESVNENKEKEKKLRCDKCGSSNVYIMDVPVKDITKHYIICNKTTCKYRKIWVSEDDS